MDLKLTAAVLACLVVVGNSINLEQGCAFGQVLESESFWLCVRKAVPEKVAPLEECKRTIIGEVSDVEAVKQTCGTSNMERMSACMDPIVESIPLSTIESCIPDDIEI